MHSIGVVKIPLYINKHTRWLTIGIQLAIVKVHFHSKRTLMLGGDVSTIINATASSVIMEYAEENHKVQYVVITKNVMWKLPVEENSSGLSKPNAEPLQFKVISVILTTTATLLIPVDTNLLNQLSQMKRNAY